jgi:hypothetical protein
MNTDRGNCNWRWAFVLVFAVALLVRLLSLAALLPKLNPDVDLDYYRSLARNLAAGNGFIAPTGSGQELPDLARTPVYPLFLAGLMKIGGDRLGLFLTVQCVLGALTCLLTILVARRWLSPGSATVAGLLVALDPNSVVRCADLRTDILFTLLVVVFVLFLSRRESWSWLLAGLVGALSVLCRPIATWVWLVVIGVALVERVRLVNLGLFMAAFLPLLGLWAARNAAISGRWFISTSPQINFAQSWLVGAEEHLSGLSPSAASEKVRRDYGSVEFFEGHDEFERSLSAIHQRGLELFRRQPLLMLKEAVTGWGGTMFGPGTRGLEHSFLRPGRTARWWPPLYVVGLLVLTALAVGGAIRLGRQAVLLSSLCLYFVLLVGGPGGGSRFRLPVMPLLTILAVSGVAGRVSSRSATEETFVTPIKPVMRSKA